MHEGRRVSVNTCVFGPGKLSRIRTYSDRYGDALGFEVLAKFDLADFEEELKGALPVLEKHRISFHGPVYGAEHSARRGSPEYEETMRHIRKTLPYARYLGSSHLVFHLNNCRVLPEKRQEMLENALDSYEEVRDLFGAFGCRIFVENTGIALQGNVLLDQEEFTDLCRQRGFDVLVDIGHAHANGWDLGRLVLDLKDQIRAFHLHNNDGRRDLHNRIHDGTLDFDAFRALIDRECPGAERTIEYTRPALEENGLDEDIRDMLGLLPGRT